MLKFMNFKRLLGFANVFSNCNSQIWLFWDETIDCTMIENTGQQITCKVNWMGNTILITNVYAKCDALLRQSLWDNLKDIFVNFSLPWQISGDFNCIIDPEEKYGGKPHRMSKSFAFLQCIMDCDLIDPDYFGSTLTLCNGWTTGKRVWQRLDRVLVNHEWVNLYDSTNVNVDHLIMTYFDHSPILTMAIATQSNLIKYLDFQVYGTRRMTLKR